MPQSTEERRQRMNNWFGDPISEAGPMTFLESRGYKLTRAWEWLPPVSQHTPNFCEMECIIFLIEEWDFGGLNREKR